MQDKITIADAPECLNTNDKAMWVLGYEAAIEARGSCLQQIQEPEADIWPCVNIDVDESGKITNAKLYSPGLPAGNHDVYPVRVPYMDEHTEAWRACVDELEKAVPGFMSLGNMNGIECAVAAIQGLAERAKHQEPAAAEQAAWHAGLDEGRAQAALPVDDRDWREPTTNLQRLREAMTLLCRGNQPTDEMLTSWIDGTSDALQDFAATHGPSWAQGIGIIDAATLMADQPTEGPEHEFRVPQAAPAAVAVPAKLPTGDEIRAIARSVSTSSSDSPSSSEYVMAGYRAALAATPAAAPVVLPEPAGYVRVPLEFVRKFNTLAHNYSLTAEAPDHYFGTERDAFSNAYARCGRDLAELRALLATATGLPAQAAKPSGLLTVDEYQAKYLHIHKMSDDERYGYESLYNEIVSGLQMPAAAPQAQAFQQRVQPWMMACFGPEISADSRERNHRFLEEALELVQSCGCTASEAHQLVDYVYGRPWGEPAQEAGGVMVTLAALCLANGLDMHACGETELARIWTKVEAIRAKQAAKPKHSPLPMHAPQAQADAQDAVAFKAAIEKLPRYTYGFKSDDWGMGSHLQSYQDPEGKFLNREEVIAAIAAAKGE